MLNLHQITVRLLLKSEEKRFQSLMQTQHYLGALPKIGETLWYVVTWHNQWIALLSFSAAALKCAVRDQWIGWYHRNQYDRLHLLANNSRFLILTDWHYPNLASKILSICKKTLSDDWQNTYGHPIILLETFVDPKWNPFPTFSKISLTQDAPRVVVIAFQAYYPLPLQQHCAA